MDDVSSNEYFRTCKTKQGRNKQFLNKVVQDMQSGKGRSRRPKKPPAKNASPKKKSLKKLQKANKKAGTTATNKEKSLITFKKIFSIDKKKQPKP